MRTLLAVFCWVAAPLAGCGYALHASVGPTIGTRGDVGALASVGAGYAIGLAPRTAMVSGVDVTGSTTQPGDTRRGVRAFGDVARRFEGAEPGAWSIGIHGGGEWNGEMRPGGGRDPGYVVVGAHAMLARDLTSHHFRSHHAILDEGDKGGLGFSFDVVRALDLGIELDADARLDDAGNWQDGRLGASVVLELVRFASWGAS